jgi:hypothetical protein
MVSLWRHYTIYISGCRFEKVQLSMEGINAEDEVRGIVPLGASYKFSPERLSYREKSE